MTNINIYLRESLREISSKRISIAPNIDEKKLNNAIKAFSYSGNPDAVIAIFDTTVFGSGKDGLLFTGEKLIYRPGFSEPVHIFYNSIKKIEYAENWIGEKKDKLERSIEVSRHIENAVSIKDLSDCDYAKLVEILQAAITNFNEYKEEKQFIPIEDMEASVKIAYIKTIINMAYDNDGLIDPKEFAEILLLMNRLNFDKESRLNLRTYMASAGGLLPLEQLLNEIEAKCPEGQIESLHISLAKDLINIFFCTGGTDIQNFEFLKKNRTLIKVTDEEIVFVEMAIKNDHDLLKEDVSDDQIVKALKVLSAKAAAVGTPLAAVYLSGSVAGMSAAGITSGLAALGVGGILGVPSRTIA